MSPKKLPGRLTQNKSTVVKAALEVFLSKGYDVSLDEIAREAAVARQTLYNQFKSKEGLFRAVVDHMAGKLIESISHFEIPGDVRGSLLNMARQYLIALLGPGSIAINRLVVTQSPEFPDLAKILYDASTKILLLDLATFLHKQNEAGVFGIPDVNLAAEYFFGGLHGLMFLRASFGLPVDSARRIEIRCNEVVDAFLKIYGTTTGASGNPRRSPSARSAIRRKQ